jgi:WD40 repeat protein
VWDALTGALVRELSGHTGAALSVAYGPYGRRLASAGADSVVRVWNPRTGEQVRELHGHTGAVWSVVYSPDGRWLASAGDDSVVRVWDAATGKLVRDLSGHSGAVRSVMFSPDGTRLASAGRDPMVRVWDSATGEACYGLLPLDDDGWAVLTPDGRYKLEGPANGEFWYAINMCRFEPGELDPYVPELRRLATDAPL